VPTQPGVARKRIWIVVSVIGALITICLFLFGPLFPWSPIQIGYDKVETRYANFYIRDKAKLSYLYTNLDVFLSQTEDLYGLSYHEKMNIVISVEESELRRFLPWINWHKVGGVALHTGNVVYINQGKANRNFDSLGFLKHEVTHILFNQNTSFANAWTAKKQQWLMEGTAVYNSGQYYLSDFEFSNEMTRRDLLYDDQSQQLFTNIDPSEGKFNYTLWGHFIKYLVVNHGLGKLQNFIQGYLEQPGDYRILFEEVYGFELSQVMASFINEYRATGE